MTGSKGRGCSVETRACMKTGFFHTATARRDSKCPRLSSQSAFKPLQGIAARLLRDYRMHTRVFWIVSCGRCCLSKRLLRAFTSARRSFADHGIIEHFSRIAAFFRARKRSNGPVNWFVLCQTVTILVIHGEQGTRRLERCWRIAGSGSWPESGSPFSDLHLLGPTRPDVRFKYV